MSDIRTHLLEGIRRANAELLEQWASDEDRRIERLYRRERVMADLEMATRQRILLERAT